MHPGKHLPLAIKIRHLWMVASLPPLPLRQAEMKGFAQNQYQDRKHSWRSPCSKRSYAQPNPPLDVSDLLTWHYFVTSDPTTNYCYCCYLLRATYDLHYYYSVSHVTVTDYSVITTTP